MELRRVSKLLRERGLQHYLARPKYFWSYGRYLVCVLQGRWPRQNTSIYVMDMPISQQVLSLNIPVRRIRCVEPLLPFALEREKADPCWRDLSFVAELEHRFARGDLCFAVEKGDRIVSVLFATFHHIRLEHVHYDLSFPKDVFGIVDAYTLPEFRGQRLYEVVFRNCVNAFWNTEFHTIYGFIPPDNLVSLLAHKRLGLDHIILQISMRQRWGVRHHHIRRLDETLRIQ